LRSWIFEPPPEPSCRNLETPGMAAARAPPLQVWYQVEVAAIKRGVGAK
jgi:hypothetical protein